MFCRLSSVLSSVVKIADEPQAGERTVKLTKTKDRAEREDLTGVRFVPLLGGQTREL
jgi:hypothetical protein